MIRSPITILLISLLLGACAGPAPFDAGKIELSLSPQQLREAPPTDSEGKMVMWGGVILDTRNLDNSTQIEVLAYPVNDRQYPMQDQPPQGRFLILQSGYLEPVDYAQGRRISVLGRLQPSQPGKIGDSDYLYPVVDAEQLKLWPKGGPSRTRFHFGLGIQL